VCLFKKRNGKAGWDLETMVQKRIGRVVVGDQDQVWKGRRRHKMLQMGAEDSSKIRVRGHESDGKRMAPTLSHPAPGTHGERRTRLVRGKSDTTAS